MKSEEITRELEQLEKQRQSVATKLDEVVEKFRDELPKLAEPWIRKEMEGRISRYPDVVQKLGKEKLSVLKTKFNKLISELPAIAKNETKDKNDWPHYRKPGTTGYGEGKNEPFFEKAFRNVVSYIGPLLQEHNLLNEPSGYGQSWQHVGGGRVRYAINTGFQDMNVESRKEYYTISRDYDDIIQKMDARKLALSHAKAQELWEAA